jgi:hypothetical protein
MNDDSNETAPATASTKRSNSDNKTKHFYHLSVVVVDKSAFANSALTAQSSSSLLEDGELQEDRDEEAG